MSSTITYNPTFNKVPNRPMWREHLKRKTTEKKAQQWYAHPDYSKQAEQLFPGVITTAMQQAIKEDDLADPIHLQFLPNQAEMTEKIGFVNDPVDDNAALKTTGLIHKYHGRVLLIASGSCAVNCRYCFRRHFDYATEFAPRNNWHSAVEYINNDDTIHEVILSGGDPLMLSTGALSNLSQQLDQITHVKTLRIHTRIPVVLPERINKAFINWIGTQNKKVVMVIHCNHANELGQGAAQALQKMSEANVFLLNQSVILKGVNDNAQVLAQLSTQLFNNNVLPYYLHAMDKVQNAAHFEVDEKTIQSIYKDLQALLPGYLVPKLVKEIAQQPNKTLLF